MERLLEALLAARPEPVVSIEAWHAGYLDACRRFDTPFDGTLSAAASVDRLGFAFVSGYQSALRSLFEDVPPERLAALCATEEGGGHPKAIEASLETTDHGLRLSGEKRFVTLGDHARTLFIVASRGSEHGKKDLVVVRLTNEHPGLSIETTDPLAFVPEIPHGVLQLDHVEIDSSDVLAGDGYLDYLKPFRTVEDIFVHAAVLAFVFSISNVAPDFTQPWRERVLAQIAALRTLSAMPPSSPLTHITLAGALADSHALIEEAQDALTASSLGPFWARDQPLLGIASKVREIRRTRAWEKLDE